jgi:hypothetical protein
MSVDTMVPAPKELRIEGYFVSGATDEGNYRVRCMKCTQVTWLTAHGLRDAKVRELLRQHRAEHGVEKGA